MDGVLFDYAEELSENYGLLICCFDGFTPDAVGGSELSIDQVHIIGTDEFVIVNNSYSSTITYTFQVAKFDGNCQVEEITADEYSQMNRWLNRKEDHKLKFDADSYANIYWIGRFNCKPIKINSKIYGIEVQSEVADMALRSITLNNLNNAIEARVKGVKFVAPDAIKVTDGLGHETVYVIPLSSTTDKGLMSAADKTKLDGIAEGAQVNILEGVKVDGTDLTVTNKKVNIDLNTPLSSIKTDIDNLEAAVESLQSGAQTYSITKVTDGISDTNVKEQYKLVDKDGVAVGDPINVYKDSSLKEVALADQELRFTYILADGSENTVGVDVSKFLAESEFSDGLQVINHIVSVKKDSTSEDFLTVGADGIKVSGITTAINNAVKDEADRAKAAEQANADAIVAEQTRAEGVESGLRTDLGNTTDKANAAGSAFARIAKIVADLTGLIGDGSGSIAEQIASAVSTLKGDVKDLDTLGKIEKALNTEIARAEGEEQKNAQNITNNKNTIDAYTINGKAISTSPTLVSSDVTLGNSYVPVSGGSISGVATTIAEAINLLDSALVWYEA